MAFKTCLCCGQPFQPRPQVQNQTHCSAPACQRERRQDWQRKKLQEDRFYRDNQRDAQRAWRERNPEYSRKYRASNPLYTEKNRAQQRSKTNEKQGSPAAINSESPWPRGILSGIYRIRFVANSENANMDAWIAEISPVCGDCPCKTDACKERT